MKSWSLLSHLKIKMGRQSNNFNFQKICVELSACSVSLIIELKVSVLQVPTCMSLWFYHMWETKNFLWWQCVCCDWTRGHTRDPRSLGQTSQAAVSWTSLSPHHIGGILRCGSPPMSCKKALENCQRYRCLHRDTPSCTEGTNGRDHCPVRMSHKWFFSRTVLNVEKWVVTKEHFSCLLFLFNSGELKEKRTWFSWVTWVIGRHRDSLVVQRMKVS